MGLGFKLYDFTVVALAGLYFILHVSEAIQGLQAGTPKAQFRWRTISSRLKLLHRTLL